MKIFHSAFSTPARYVMEIFLRLSSTGKTMPGRGYFIFNPLFVMEPPAVAAVFNELEKLHDCMDIVVLGDANNVPVGYFIPPSLDPGEARYLMLLSTVDSQKDCEFMQKAFFLRAHHLTLDSVSLSYVLDSGFYYNSDYINIYKWTTETAMDVLSELPGPEVNHDRHIGEKEISKNKEIRDSIPFNAIMPYQAGDVLFFTIAARNMQTHINGVVVNKVYHNIIVDNMPEMNTVSLDLSPPHRDGATLMEEKYFYSIAEKVPPKCFYYYCRPCRQYNVSLFHLIDHFAFALGASFLSSKELLINTKPAPKLYRPEIDNKPFKVLLHFGGGWPIKIYPENYQAELIDLLLSKGYEVTVLRDSSPEKSDKYNCVKFENMAQLVGLLESHHLLLGTDSFPCHYTAHVLGLPTICLFTSTRPENSNARVTDYYNYLERKLSCRPCVAVDICPMNRKQYCENSVDPEVVYNKIVSMLENVYLKDSVKYE